MLDDGEFSQARSSMQRVRRLTNMLPKQVRFSLRRMYYGGGSVECPLCGNHPRSLISHGGRAPILDERKVVGGTLRENDRCPICHGCDRTRLMMLYLETHTEIGRIPLRILHVAPDHGLYLWIQRQARIDYVCTDLDAQRYRHIKGLQTADLTALPFEANSFDILICSHVLEHVPDDAAAFREIRRVLKPGGQALLLAPFAMDGQPTEEDPSLHDADEQLRRFGQWDHVRIYSRDDFLARMEAAELQASLFKPACTMPARAKALSLNPLEALPVGIKPKLSG